MKAICTGALALALLSLLPGPSLEAASPHVFRFFAQWSDNADGADCTRSAFQLTVFSTQADVDVAEFNFFSNDDPCNPESGGEFAQGSGLVEVNGNLARLSVQGTIPSGDREVDVDLTLRKTGNLPDPAPGEKAVSASARGTVILDGNDLTRGRASTTATITRSKS
jgi:hypothetical protein